MTPDGTSMPSGTTAPAATTEPRPIFAPERTVAPMAIRASSSTVQAWRTAPWPTVTRAPTRQGRFSSTWTTDPSWMFESSPISIPAPAMSARRTQLYQTLAPLRTVTRPMTTAPGATQAPSSMVGRLELVRCRSAHVFTP